MRFQSVASQIAEENQYYRAAPAASTPVIPVVGRWGPSGARYINRESQRRYQPHHQEELEFVRNDRPRRWLLKGGEGCVAAETLIEGIPAAEWTGGTVTTLFGTEVASKAYLKGRADLYRLRTKSGREVVVTLDHRFLTPTGWKKLRDLFLGNVIAANDNERDPIDSEIPKDCSDRCSHDFHPYDARSSQKEWDDPSKWPQPATIAYASRSFPFSFDVPLLDHLCKTHSSFRGEQIRLEYDGEYLHVPYDDGPLLPQYLSDCRFQLQTNPNDRVRLLHRSMPCFESPFREVEDSVVYGSNKWSEWIVAESPSCLESSQTYHSIENETDLHRLERDDPLDAPFLKNGSTSYNYKAFWDEIQAISFVRYGDFYDLTVPGAEHYEAQGLFHHNSGKSVAGIVKDLERLRRGMSGIMGSPTLVHFRKSLWPEFRRWCPPNAIIPSQRYRLDIGWQPNQPFELVFEDMGSGHATLLCGGFDSPGSWEGPNVNFAHIDEGRHLASPAMAKVLDGRCRIAGPNGEPPQWWVTTTPRKSRLSTSPEDAKFHWLFEMFGPWEEDGEDPFQDFKEASRVTTLRLEDNAANLADGFVEERIQSLTAKEVRILAKAEWEDEDDTERFLPNMVLWDSLAVSAPPLGREPLIVALDAATGRKTTTSDCFGLVAVAPRSHFLDGAKGSFVRYVEKWQAKAGGHIEYSTSMLDGPGDRIRWLIDNHNVTCVTFDPHQLVFVAQALEQEGRVWIEPYSQGNDRLISDRHLYDQIIQKETAFDPMTSGMEDLRAHIDNADRKVDSDKHNFRLVQGRGKIDLAVCLSMASKQLSELNL